MTRKYQQPPRHYNPMPMEGLRAVWVVRQPYGVSGSPEYLAAMFGPTDYLATIGIAEYAKWDFRHQLRDDDLIVYANELE